MNKNKIEESLNDVNTISNRITIIITSPSTNTPSINTNNNNNKDDNRTITADTC